MIFLKKCAVIIMCLGVASMTQGREYHVSPNGSDTNNGSISKMLCTISAAAAKAYPGDTITVHAGIYRERINPPRGGKSDSERITYRAALGEQVTIKGSELIKGWKHDTHNTWHVTIPNSFFGNFNPYKDLIHGDWFFKKGLKHHTGTVYQDETWLTEAAKQADVMKVMGKTSLWFGKVNKTTTTIWAQFKNINPNKNGIEINVRQSIFYPKKPNINYITVRGFIMKNAATPWAPPTAEQIGLIGTHWSKGWIIENNQISHSKCVGIALGKHGDEFDNTSANSATGYIKTIERGLSAGWSKENIGHHIVKNNHIHNCEQAGIVGSLGAIFSTITGNEIHDIHILRRFSGFEQAGIKIHAAIDTEISNNHIYRTNRGIWLDWMTQGTRITGNLLHNNGPNADLFIEVNHGPFMVDNNIFLSKKVLRDVSEGGAYVHNLFAGSINVSSCLNRKTPYHKEHTEKIAGIVNIKGGDDRFYNNIFSHKANLSAYDKAAYPMIMAGNVYTKGSNNSIHDKLPLKKSNFDIKPKLMQKPDGWYLNISLNPVWQKEQKREVITTKLLGKAIVPNLPFVLPNGDLYNINKDYLGNKRDSSNPNPGPFTTYKNEKLFIKVRSTPTIKPIKTNNKTTK